MYLQLRQADSYTAWHPGMAGAEVPLRIMLPKATRWLSEAPEISITRRFLSPFISLPTQEDYGLTNGENTQASVQRNITAEMRQKLYHS